jgi:hypothetical protein
MNHSLVHAVIPFHPQLTRRHPQQVQTTGQARAIGKRQFRAHTSQIIT